MGRMGKAWLKSVPNTIERERERERDREKERQRAVGMECETILRGEHGDKIFVNRRKAEDQEVEEDMKRRGRSRRIMHRRSEGLEDERKRGRKERRKGRREREA